MTNGKVYSHTDKHIPILYICFYKTLYDKYSKLKVRLYNTDIISSIRQYLTHNVAYSRNEAILDDLVHYGLIIKVGRNLYELNIEALSDILKQTEQYWAW